MGCVYLITVKNEKRYVGMTIREDATHRVYCHKKSDKPIGNALRKHKEYLLKILFKSDDRSELCRKEIYYIKRLKTQKPHGYNLTAGGDGSAGHSMSSKNKALTSQRMRGNKNLSGKHWSPERRAKILATRKKRGHSQALSKGLRRKWKDPIYRKKMLGILAVCRRRRWDV